MHRSEKFIDHDTDTLDVINDMCNECETPLNECSHSQSYPYKQMQSQQYHCSPREKYDPGVSSFTSIITPISGLIPQYSGCMGSVEFRMRRKNKTVTLQWEPFTGSLASSGVAYITVAQTICNMPPYPVSFPIFLQYRGVGRVSNITIDPLTTSGGLKFYLNTDASSNDTNIGDSFYMNAGAVTWVVD